MRHLRTFLLLAFALSGTASLAEGGQPRPLSLMDARAIALAKHPKITLAELQALAARQVVRQAQSALLPTINANSSVSLASDPTGVATMTQRLYISTVLNRASVSLMASQLITDFGHTSNLIASTRYQAEAQAKNIEATQAQILVDVDAAYFLALQAQALLKVADQTVHERQLIREKVALFVKHQIKSDLDLSFAEVNFQQALLLRSKAQNDVHSAFANLAALLAEPEQTTYLITDQHPYQVLPDTVAGLTEIALHHRPELAQLTLQREGAAKFAKAQRALDYPTISLQGTTGEAPYHEPNMKPDYAAGGGVANVPLFTGGLNDALQKNANIKTAAADAALADKALTIQRDVRIAWLNMKNAEELVTITAKLADQASRTLDLAQARYNVRTKSILEFSQAQLNKTSADIDRASARYELMLRRSILAYQIGNLMPSRAH